MRALIVAGAATLAGIGGVVGLSGAMNSGSASTSDPPPVAAATDGDADALQERIARVRRAERLADAAIARSRATAGSYPRPTSAPVPTVPSGPRGEGSVDEDHGAVGTYVDETDDREDDDREDDDHDDHDDHDDD